MEIKAPRISIIIPVYNVVNHLTRCIESILDQEESDWELILIDDGSSDGSEIICDNFVERDSRIAVVHKMNEGVSIARNLGISLAKAEWICFVDSDDWVEPRYLSDMLVWVDDEHTVVYGNLIHDYTGERPCSIGNNYKDGDGCDLHDEDVDCFIVDNRIIENGYPFAKLFHKRILANRIHFNHNISFHEDHIFVLDYLLTAERIILSAKPNYHYMHRFATNSLSKKKHPAKNMIVASTELLRVVKAVITRFSIEDIVYRRRLYTLLGLNQLIRAALDADSHELSMVGNMIRTQKRLFIKYYSPNHLYVKLIPFLFFIRLDRLVLWINRLIGKLF